MEDGDSEDCQKPLTSRALTALRESEHSFPELALFLALVSDSTSSMSTTTKVEGSASLFFTTSNILSTSLPDSPCHDELRLWLLISTRSPWRKSVILKVEWQQEQ